MIFMNILKVFVAAILTASLLILSAAAILPGTAVNAAEAQEPDPVVIMLDTGHGGNDPGAIRTVGGVEYTERAFNDKLMNACYGRLTAYDGVIVYRTRVANNHISTYARAEYAARVGADLFLSFHINSSDYKSAHGASTIIPIGHYKPEIKTAAANLTEKILNGLTAVGLKNNGFLTRALEDADYLEYPDGSAGDYYEVIRRGVVNGIPSLILETAFITSDTDLAILKDDAKIREIGAIVADAIANQFGLKITGNTLTQPVQTAQTSGVSLGSVPGTLNFGEKYTLTASGGSGEGEYAFLATNPFIGRTEGNELILTGSGQLRLTVTRLEGETTTPRSAGNTAVTVKPLETSLTGEVTSVRFSQADNCYYASVTANFTNRVEYVVPRGTVKFTADNGAASSGKFGENWELTVELPFLSAGNYTCALSYDEASYDGYKVSGAVVNVTIDDSQLTTEEPTQEPTLEPTEVPTESAAPATDATDDATPTDKSIAAATAEVGNDNASITFGTMEILMCLLIVAVVIVAVLLMKLIAAKKREKQ